MPVRTIPGTDVQYHLLCLDENGVERKEADGTLLSDVVTQKLQDRDHPITDVFLCSHGWQGDVPAAVAQYDKWVGAMAQSSDAAVARATRVGFSSIVVGVHWPSLPFGDEAMPSGVLGDEEDALLEAQVNQYANSIADTPAARAAIRIILEASARDDGERETLPANVRDAYEELAREASLANGGSNPGGAPGSEHDEWNADAIAADARETAIAAAVSAPESADQTAAPGVLGGGFFGTIKGWMVKPLQMASFWKMKDRARVVGESGVHALLTRFQNASLPSTRYHLMGHSFGCIVMSSTVAGAPDSAPLPRPVDSLFLVQGALSLWSYSPDIPVAPGNVGYFNRTIANGFVRGPIVTTQSRFDQAVSTFYPKGAALKSQFVLGDELPKYGGVGVYGIQGVGDVSQNLTMKSVTSEYSFLPGHVYNLESSDVIKKNEGFGVGAHSDFAHPEVAHAFWQAVLSVA